MSDSPLPPGWGSDELTGFLEDARRNRFATFANKGKQSRRLIAIDACFMRVAREWLNPANLITPLFFVRSHSAYRAACEHAMAGQTTDAFPQIRACLEYAGYALHIDKNPNLAETWLRRHDDEDSKRAVINEFRISNIRATIEEANRDAAKVFKLLYERAIDCGGHPNEMAITGSLKMLDQEDRKTFVSIYLHGDGPPLENALKTTAQTGICALEILREAFPGRFEILGVNAALLTLRKGL